MKTKLLITAVSIFAITAIGNGQTGNRGRGQGLRQGAQTAYTDNNNNQVCDNYENRTTGQCTGKAYRKGNRKGKGNGNGSGNANRYGRKK